MKSSEKEKIQMTLNEFPNIIKDPASKLTFTTRIKADINTTNNDSVYSKSYPYRYGLKDEVKRQIEKLFGPSRSPYNAPLWIVNKKLDALW